MERTEHLTRRPSDRVAHPLPLGSLGLVVALLGFAVAVLVALGAFDGG